MIILSAVIFILPSISRIGHGEVYLPDVRHVGCYKNTYSRNNGHGYYVNPLTWEVCVMLCSQKNARYAGIEASKSFCYCGNYLAQNSDKVTPFSCDEDCYGDSTKSCGGEETMSLYKLKNTTSFSFLVTTDNGIAYFKDNVLSSNFVSLPVIAYIKADYHYSRNEIYFYARKRIHRSSYVPILRQYLPPTIILELEHESSGLAVDWVSNKLYWTEYLTTNTSHIKESNLDGSNQRVLYTSVGVLDVVVDPYARRLFYITNHFVSQFNLDTQSLVAFDMLGDYRFDGVTNLAVDVHRKALYAVGYHDANKKNNRYLVSTDYYSSFFKVLLSRPSLANCYSLNGLDGQLFWGEYNPSSRALISFKIPEGGDIEVPQIVSQLTQNVGSLKLYHEHAQTAGKVHFCRKWKCSHECRYSLQTSATCRCPENMRLGIDKKTCQDLPRLVEETEKAEEDEDYDLDDEDYFFTLKTYVKGKKNSTSNDKSKKKIGVSVSVNSDTSKVKANNKRTGK